MDFLESREVQIPPVEKVNGARFEEELVEILDLVNFAGSHENERRNAAPQIHKRMKLDGPLVEILPRGKHKDKGRSCWYPKHKRHLPALPRNLPGHKGCGPMQSRFGRSPHRYASRGLDWREPRYCGRPFTKAHVVELLSAPP